MAVAPVYPVLSEMNLRQVHEEISVADSELTMAWCRRYGLLKTERTCMRCHDEMRLVAWSGVDGKIWQCGKLLDAIEVPLEKRLLLLLL